jgi:fumarylpyruvate hydrolase
VALGRGGANVSVADAPALVFGHAVGIDLTRRDLQAAAKQAGRPWDMAKGFDQSAPLGALARGLPPATGAIALSVNGEQRQAGDLAQMIWNVAEIIATLSTFVTLAGGDLIFTGTPAGVGPLRPGDRLCATLAGVTSLEIGFRG